MNPPAKIRVLIIAEAASPNLISVPLIGWSLTNALSEVADVHLATELRSVPDLLAAGWPADRMIAIDNQIIQRNAWRLWRLVGWSAYTGITSLTYPLFELKLLHRIGRDLHRGRWDIVHRITPLSVSSPSLLAQRCRGMGIPFVIGPVNGGLPWPKQFPELATAERDFATTLRPGMRVMPGWRATWKAAHTILLGSLATALSLPISTRRSWSYLPENAIDETRFPRTSTHTREANSPLKLLFLGRLVALKGVDLAIEAIAPLLRNGQATFTIVGVGPEEPKLRQLAKRLGVESTLIWMGLIPHTLVAEQLRAHHVLLFPSLREFGGGVILEAMACGAVPIVVKYGGPGELVKPGWGLSVPLTDRPRMIAALGEAVAQLAADEPLRQCMALAGQNEVYYNFTWRAKARHIAKIYGGIVAKRQTQANPARRTT